MNIGVPRETGRHERRVSLTPWAAAHLTRLGHTVVVESGAGAGARFADDEYQAAGATVVFSREEAFKRADLVCAIAMVSDGELDLLRPESVLCGFQHLSITPRPVVEHLRTLRMTAISYELVQDAQGQRPLLIPMSEMAGEMAVFVAAHYLQNQEGGRGILLGAVPGIAPPTVLVLGAGTVGRAAAARAAAIGAHVIVMDESLEKLRTFRRRGGNVVTQVATPDRLERYTAIADVVIGAILIPGARAPFLVTDEMVRGMRAGSVIVDVSIDQGGCIETSRPTTPDDPVYVMHDVVHYCVPNMTANVARTASRALSDALLGPVTALATLGVDAALRADAGLAAGVSVYHGELVNAHLAEALGLPARTLDDLLPAAEGTP
ncbi:MAG: alanine dehydrogenase [Gemmatimonadota bacterium]|nr:alanine dehydrogenase [Gemmatimonadota bacterium]MDH5198441.1 alanine dehydrogenase [Gemmatimonadota bacterium]